MSYGHCRRRPEGEQKSQIERMSNHFIGTGSLEFDRCVFSALQVKINLPQSEKVEMIDQECGDQDSKPAESIEAIDRRADDLILYIPDHSAHWLPLPEQQEQCQAGE